MRDSPDKNKEIYLDTDQAKNFTNRKSSMKPKASGINNSKSRKDASLPRKQGKHSKPLQDRIANILIDIDKSI